MVKPLSFKGDKKPKKRKRAANNDEGPSAINSDKFAKLDQEEEDIENDNSWVSADSVSDVTGPVMFVLSTSPPTALACDAAGKVYSLPVENMVDGNLGSAEPHDLRQVWVANKVAGTDMHRFKGSHGKFLGCDKYGLLTATSDAITRLESFSILSAPEPGMFYIRTSHQTFLYTQPSKEANAAPEVRGDWKDDSGLSFACDIRIRMQACFKPRVKARKEEKALQKISRAELEKSVGRRLGDDEVKKLKRARKDGSYHEMLLDFKVKGKHDKYG